MANYLDNIDIIDADNHSTNVLLQDRGTLAFANQLSIDLQNEIQNRINSDTALGTRIDNEELARSSADNALNNRINNLSNYDKADIRNYGGIADNNTDCTNAVIQALSENNVAYLPNYNNNSYKIGAVTLTDGQTIIGDEGTKISSTASDFITINGNNTEVKNLIITTSNNVIHINNDKQLSFINIENVYSYGANKFIYDNENSNYTYTNLYVNRCAARQHYGNGLLLYHCLAFLMLNNVTIDSVGVIGTTAMFEIHNNAGAHLTHCEAEGGYSDGSHTSHCGFNFMNCQALWLERCMSDTNDSVGFNFYNCQYIYLSSCVASLMGSHGFAFLGTNSAHIMMTNCYIGGRRGMASSITGAHGIYNYAGYFTISNCDISNMTGYAIADAATNNNANYNGIIIAGCDRSFVAFSSNGGTLSNVSSLVNDTPTIGYYKCNNCLFNGVEWQFNCAVRYTGTGYEYFSNGSWLNI